LENSILFSACYGFPPNGLGYCGHDSFSKVLRNYLVGKASIGTVESELKKFKAQYAYLKFIGRESGLDPFHPKVVEAFWLGNTLLENVSYSSMQKFIKINLFPKSSVRAKSLAKNLPKGLFPHHSFNVLYIHFVTNKVNKSVENFDSCCITAGKVTSISDSKAIVDRFSIEHSHCFCFGRKVSKVDLVRGGLRLVKNLKKGDLVAVHWGMVVGKLTTRQYSLLRKYTQKTINYLND